MQWRLLLTIVAALSMGCAEEDTVSNGGTGGQGGSDGAGGTGGPGGAGGVGGGGGENGSAGGTGGEPEDVDYGWLTDPEIWTEVELEEPPNSFTILEGDPAGFRFPQISWQGDCGEGCRSATLEFGEVTDDVVVGGVSRASLERYGAVVAVSHYMDDLSIVRRIVPLSGGGSTYALQVVPQDPQERDFVVGSMPEDSEIFLLIGSQGRLWVAFDSQNGWDIKRPWHQESQYARWCHPFSLDADPPVAFFGCENGLHVMKEKGSSSEVVIPDSQNSAVGTGNDGVAVWAQHRDEEEQGRFSRIRAWTPDDEAKTIKELPGDVCGLAIASGHIAGFIGDSDSQFCGWGVSSPRFFWMDREDGEVTEGPVLPGDLVAIRSLTTTDEFTAGKAVLPPDVGIPHDERMRVVLLRHSDGKMRQFLMPPTGYSMGQTTVALDDEYLYFTRWNSAPGDHSFDRVFRYRLDRFDEIGLPYPPEGD